MGADGTGTGEETLFSLENKKWCVDKYAWSYQPAGTETTQYSKKNSNSEQHFDCFNESTFRPDFSHQQDYCKTTEANIYMACEQTTQNRRVLYT